MTRSVRAACLVIAFAGAALLGLLAMPMGCGGQEVIIARAGPGDAASDGARRADGGEASSPCSGDHGVPPPWWCAGDAEANASCHDGGPFCVGDDARARPAVEAGAAQRCASNDDCIPPTSTFCAKSSCDAPEGECEERPVACDHTPDNAGPLVCGCDGVNYWSDCLRKADGVASRTQGECTFPFAACDGGAPPHTTCPVPDAFCFIQSMGECNGAIGEVTSGGVCWVLPFECPAEGGVRNWQSCGETPGECVDLCSAIQSSKPHARAGIGCQ